MEVTVRQANLNDEADAQAVREMTQAYALDPQGAGRELPDEVMERLVPALAEHPAAIVFLATRDGRPVGIATCFISFSTFVAKPIINVHDLSVVPEARGVGVASRLFDAVEAEAAGRGCCRITLEVSAKNHHARKVYAARGFRGALEEDDARVTYFCGKDLPAEC